MEFSTFGFLSLGCFFFGITFRPYSSSIHFLYQSLEIEQRSFAVCFLSPPQSIAPNSGFPLYGPSWLILFAWGFRRLRAASDFLDAQKVTKEPLGGGSGWALRAHIRRPLEPHYGGRATGRFLNISGAQNLSGLCDSSLRRRGFRIPRFVLPDKARSLHRSSSPTQTRFAGLCVGGRLRRPVWVENFSWFHWCAWVFSANAPGAGYLIRPLRGHLPLKGKAGAISKPSPLGRFPLSGGNVPKGRKCRAQRMRSVGAAHWAARGLIWGRPLRKAPYGERNVPLKPSLR